MNVYIVYYPNPDENKGTKWKLKRVVAKTKTEAEKIFTSWANYEIAAVNIESRNVLVK